MDQQTQAQKNQVVVIDIRMPFWSMVGFMVKWAIAAIPALAILVVIGFALATAVMGFMGFTSGFITAPQPAVSRPAPGPIPFGWVQHPTSPGLMCSENDPTYCRTR